MTTIIPKGLTVTVDVERAIRDLQNGLFKYVIFRYDLEQRSYTLVDTGDKFKSYSDLQVPEHAPVYAAINFTYMVEDKKQNQLVFLNWCPNSCSVRVKMTHNVFKADVKHKLIGLENEEWIEIQATDNEEKTYETVCNSIAGQLCPEYVRTNNFPELWKTAKNYNFSDLCIV